MPGNTAAAFTKVQMELQAGGVPCELSECQVGYGLNMIPTAMVKLALGRNGSGKMSKAKEVIKQITNSRVPISITAKFEGGNGDKSKIFEGYITGDAQDAAAGQTVGAALYCEHFSADLDTANKVSPAFHSSSSNAVWYTMNTVGGEQAMTAVKSGSPVAQAIAPDPQSDIWGNCVKPIFKFLAEKADRFPTAPGLNKIGQGSRNKWAIAALEKVNGMIPAALTGDSAALRRQLTDVLHMTLIDPSTGQTFWETMLNFGSIWKMACIPRFKDILYVPFVETVKTTHKKIALGDYFYSSSQQNKGRTPIRGVALFTPSTMANVSVANGYVNGIADMSQFGGADLSGQMLCLDVPSAFIDLLPTDTVSKNTPASSTTISHMSNPKVSESPSASKFYADLGEFGNRTLDKVAKAMLATYRYKGRSAQIVGKWRTDICPGSPVAVEILTGIQGETELFYGIATGVSFNVTADQPSVDTRITVGFLHSAAEHESSPLISDEHPLYGNTFKGAPL